MWLALRDTWERDHGDELRSMIGETILLIHDGEDEQGIAKYEAVLTFIGDRQLESHHLRQPGC